MCTSRWPSRVFGQGHRIGRAAVLGLTVVLSLAGAPTAFAQTSRSASGTLGKWDAEVHGSIFTDLIGGDSLGDEEFGTLPTGTPFTTVNGLPSRAVPSWAFGDGAALFEEVRRAFAATHGVTLPAIVPLDDVLFGRGIQRTPAVAFGARFARHVTSWFAAEFSVDRGPLDSAASGSVIDAVEATRASYTSAFQALLATVPQTGGRVTVSATTPSEASNSQTILTGSARLSFVNTSRVGVHAIVGGGLIMNDASPLVVRLQSNYQFSVFSQFPINESETVTIQFEEKKRVPVVVLGIGAAIRVAGPTGVRIDGRFLASQNSAISTLNATPSRVGAAQTIALPSFTTPSIQFSTANNARTTLSGDPINGLVTYRGKGLDLRPQVTIGYFVRF